MMQKLILKAHINFASGVIPVTHVNTYQIK